jgi:hypothetical protein
LAASQAGGAGETASAFSSRLCPPPSFLHHPTAATEVRGLKVGERPFHFEQASSGGLQQNTQRPRNGEPLFTCKADSQPFIHQQQVRMFSPGELNRLPLAKIESCQASVVRFGNLFNDQP